MSSVSKLEEIESEKKKLEDLLKAIEKDEIKAKKVFDEKTSEINVKKNAFEAQIKDLEKQLKETEKDEIKAKKVFDDKMSDILLKKKAYEDQLKTNEKNETKIKKTLASSASKKKSAKSDSDSEEENTKKKSTKNDSSSDDEKKTKKKAIPKKIRELVWNQWIGHDVASSMCTCCEKTPIKNIEFHCGHVIAEANGGTMQIDNLRPICAGCNLSMGTQDMNDFKKVFGLGKKETIKAMMPIVATKKNQ